MRRRRNVRGWLVGGVLVAAASLRAQDAPVFRSAVDAVTVDVSVRRGNRPVTGLTAPEFTLTDNGVPQAISAITYEKQPIDLTVLLDVSGSVSGAVLEQLRQAVSDLAKTLLPNDRMRVVTFSMFMQRILDVDQPADITAETFRGVTAGGSSAVRDALAVALVAPPAGDRRQFVVLFSDGNDSSSVSSPETLVDIARRTSPTVSLVLAMPYRQDPEPVYRALAAETGGTIISLLPGDDLGNGFRRALEQFRSSYVLTYSPTGVDRMGDHAIDVRVDRDDVTVRARRGYVVQ